jgi:filamentous hemagglutinin family protein
MTESGSDRCCKLGLLCCLAISGAIASSGDCAFAQIRSDDTLGTAEQSRVIPDIIRGVPGDRIDGGAIRDVNLFHSFQEFNVDAERGAYFTNPPGIKNILARVTGNYPSKIFGKLGVLGGDANLFLLNPKGIIFGSNASLDVGGSFVATTANAIQFGDRGFFSASTPNKPGLLTVNPSALLFNQIAAPISSSSREPAGQRLDPFPSDPSALRDLFGLRVPDGRSLLLVGGNVTLDGGVPSEVGALGGGLNALGGRVELAGIAGTGSVGLDVSGNNLSLSFPNRIALADVYFTNRATVDISSDKGGGEIQVQGKQVMLAGGSRILSTALGSNAGGNLTVNASDSTKVIERSGLSTTTEGAGTAGDLTINTGRLIVANGGQVLTSTSSAGLGGQLTVNALEFVELAGTSPFGFPSSFSSATAATGNAGNLTINTGSLIIQGGAKLSTESSGAEDNFGNFTPATGRGGDLTVNASESVELIGTRPDGTPSGIFASTKGTGRAGNLMIATGKLTVSDQAEVTVSSEGIGNAGDLKVQANSVRLENGGKLTSTSALGTGGGNISLSDLNLLLLRGNSEISTNAEGEGNGGDITINTDLLIGLDNSDITATAIKGRGGNIQINTQGIFGIEPRSQRTPRSDITASSELGVDGLVEINRPDVDPTSELVVLPAEIVDVSGLVAQGCAAVGGNVAGGSQFVVTGRGGLPPNPTEATRSDPVLADLGSPIQNQENRASADIPIKSTFSEPDTLVEAQGWVIGSKGEVVLTAAAVTPDIPWLTPNSCHGS